MWNFHKKFRNFSVNWKNCGLLLYKNRTGYWILHLNYEYWIFNIESRYTTSNTAESKYVFSSKKCEGYGFDFFCLRWFNIFPNYLENIRGKHISVRAGLANEKIFLRIGFMIEVILLLYIKLVKIYIKAWICS